MKKLIFRILQTFVIALLIWWLFHDIDIPQLFHAIAKLHGNGIILTLLAVIASDMAIAFRWYYLSRYRHPFLACVSANMLAFFLNTFIPAKMGDLSKIYYLSKNACIDPKESSAIFIIERFFDVIILGFMLLFSTIYVVHNTILTLTAFILFGLAVLFFYAIYHRPFLKKLIRSLPMAKFRTLLYRIALMITHNLTPKRALATLLLTLVMWMLYYLSSIVFFTYATSFHLTLIQIFIATTFAFSFAAIPLTPGGIGTFQAAFVFVLGWYGIPKEEALSASMVLQFLSILPATVYSIFLFFTKDIQMG